jgi:hypothetical protein
MSDTGSTAGGVITLSTFAPFLPAWQDCLFWCFYGSLCVIDLDRLTHFDEHVGAFVGRFNDLAGFYHFAITNR